MRGRPHRLSIRRYKEFSHVKKLLATLVATFMAAAGLLFVTAGVASAEPGAGDGNSDHGLCTAYFNGQKVGHGEGESGDYPAPFEGLETRSEEYTDNDRRDNDNDAAIDEPDETDETDTAVPEHTSLTDAENIYNYCENSPVVGALPTEDDGSLIGGSPEHGRFTCSNDGSTIPQDSVTNPDSNTDPECTRNEKPGKADDR
jgi:hypothetical protein